MTPCMHVAEDDVGEELGHLPTRAAQIVEFVAVPEQNKEKAVEIVKEYLTAFVSVVQPDPIS